MTSGFAARVALRALALLAFAGAVEWEELHADNFDETLGDSEGVLVHFTAPWSVNCREFQPELNSVADSPEWSDKLVFGTSDISDDRGYTSYLETYGITRLPTVVLFRNGHPEMYPHSNPRTQDGLKKWLREQFEKELMPRGELGDDLEAKLNAQMLQQLDAHAERILQKRAEEERTQGEANSAARKEARAAAVRSRDGVPAPEEVNPSRTTSWQEAGGGDGGGGGETGAAANARRMAEEALAAEYGVDADGNPVSMATRQAAREAKPAPAAPQQPAPAKAGGGGGGKTNLASDPRKLEEAVAESAAAHAGGAAAAAAGSSGDCASLAAVRHVRDADFEKVALDKAKDMYMLFYKPSTTFCDGPAAKYASYVHPLPPSSVVQAARMDLTSSKSPFVFEDSELPVVMLFPAKDKRPLEFTGKVEVDALQAFCKEHCKEEAPPEAVGAAADADAGKSEL